MLRQFTRTDRLLLLNGILLVVVIGLTCAVLLRVNSGSKRPVDLVKAWKVTAVDLNVDSRIVLQDGDLIIGVNGKKVWSQEALRSALPGTLTILRGENLDRFYLEITEPELRATIEPRSIFMLREFAPL